MPPGRHSPEPGSSIGHKSEFSSEMPFHLSAARFSRSVFRVPLAGFHLADLKANPGPKAHISLLSALRTEVMRTPASLARQSLLSAYHPAQDSQLTQRSRGYLTEVRFDTVYYPPGRAPDDTVSSRTPALCRAFFRFNEAEGLRPTRSAGYP